MGEQSPPDAVSLGEGVDEESLDGDQCVRVERRLAHDELQGARHCRARERHVANHDAVDGRDPRALIRRIEEGRARAAASGIVVLRVGASQDVEEGGYVLVGAWA